jgi:uncharacterized SAM-binding protein YcdF (DUF218 family)
VYEPLRLVTQPLTTLLILLTFTTLLALRRAASARWRVLVVVLTLLVVAVSHPYAAWRVTRALEAQYPPVTGAAAPPSVRALVVLSGGMMAGDRNQGVLAEDSLVRTICAAELARRISPEVIVVTGGIVNPATPASAAERMRDLLVTLGLASERILVEGRAMTTVGNARESRALLAPRGLMRVGLVTQALHMPRSVGIFRAEGFDVVPLSCDAQAGPGFHFGLSTLLPGPRAAWLFNRAAHEWVSLSYYRLRGEWK